MIKFAVVHRARDGLALSASTDVDSEVIKLRESKRFAKILSRKARQFPVRSFMLVGGYTIFMTTEADVCFLMISELNYQTVLAYSFLDDLKKQFLNRYTHGALEKAVRPYSFIEFDNYILKVKQRYNNTRTLYARLDLSAISEELKSNPPVEVTEYDLGQAASTKKTQSIFTFNNHIPQHLTTQTAKMKQKLLPLTSLGFSSILISIACTMMNCIRLVPFLSQYQEKDDVSEEFWLPISFYFMFSITVNISQIVVLFYPLSYRNHLNYLLCVTSCLISYSLRDLRNLAQILFHISSSLFICYNTWKRPIIRFINDSFHREYDVNGSFNYSAFQPFEKIENELHKLARLSNAKNSFTLFDIGETSEQRKLWAFKIQRKDNKTRKLIVIDCGAHAREWIAPATCMYILNKFVTSNDSDLVALVEKCNWVFIPLLNPDGYAYTWYNKTTRLWRKNRSATNEQIRLRKEKNDELCIGVDINRNFDKAWGGPGAPKNNPCYEMYAGGKPFSERESSALATYLNNTREEIIVYLTLHSYSQSWMTPWGYKSVKPKYYDNMIEVARRAVKSMKKYSGVRYNVGPSHNLLYPSSGNSCDWAYSKLNISYSYMVEMYPNCNVTEDTAFLVSSKEMMQNAKEIYVGIKTMGMEIEL